MLCAYLSRLGNRSRLTPHSIPFVVISHFIINLQQANSSGPATSVAATPSKFSSPRFRIPPVASIVGNMGQPLDHGFDDENEGELNECEIEIIATESTLQNDTGVETAIV